MAAPPPLTGASAAATTLQLDRALQNRVFQSWRIGADFVGGRAEVQLPGRVLLSAGDAVDLLHVKAAGLRNHLLQSGGRLYVVTAAGQAGQDAAIAEVVVQQSPSGRPAVPSLRALSVVPSCAEAAGVAGAPVEATLHCSLAVVAEAQEPAAAAGAYSGPLSLLFTSGRGDLVLLQPAAAADAGCVCSAPVFPLRPRAPATGVKPFTIEAAWRSSSSSGGFLHCVLSSPHHAGHAQHGRPAWVCEVWLVTLDAATHQQQQQQQQLRVVGVQLLLVSRSPPVAAVAGGAGAGQLLLVGEPGLEADELPPGYQQQQRPVPAATGTSSSHPAAAAAAAAAAAGDTMNNDDSDMDPRTLAEAVVRLAKYTSDTPVGELPQQQWSDVFREGGPDELGPGGGDGEGGEASPTVMLFAPSSSSSGEQPQQWVLQSSVSCSPHRLLAAQLSTSAAAVAGQPGVLLGLTDDVDCAVITAGLAASSSGGGARQAGGTPPPPPTPPQQQQQQHDAAVVVVRHLDLLPALAYVVAGKTQRRHLLLAPSSPAACPVSAVLVEGSKYAYLYGHVGRQATHGQQQVLDMQLPPGESILGAALVAVAAGGGSSAAATEAAADAPGGSGGTLLLLLTSGAQLVCYQLQQPRG